MENSSAILSHSYMNPVQDLIYQILDLLEDEDGFNTLFLIENNSPDTWIVSAIDRKNMQTISVAESDTLYSAFQILLEIVNDSDEPVIH